MHVLLMDDNRIGATSVDYDCGEGQFDFDFPENFDFNRQNDYQIIDSKLIYNPIEANYKPSASDVAFANQAINAALSS